MNHISIDTSCLDALKVPSRDKRFLVILKVSSALFPAHDTINDKYLTEIL